MTKSASEITAYLKARPERWAAFQEWWDEDWSWDALPTKLQYEAIGKISLQDYWGDQESRLIEFGGRRWTIVHLPPCDRNGTTCSAWSDMKADLFWSVIEQQLPNVSLPIKDVMFVHEITPQPALFHGVVFPEWRKDLGPKIISAHFEKCLFLGWCAFSNLKIANSFFDNARFIGDATYFDSTEFLTGAHFSGVQILSGSIVTFSEAKFDGEAHFRGSRLSWPSFNNAVFGGGCDFSDAICVDSGIYFTGAEFGGGYAHFDRIVVNGVADFSFAKFNSVASFTDAEFKYDVYFRSDKGGKFAAAADFNGAVFNRVADFSGRSFNQTTDFRGARFGGLPMFYDCELVGETLFDASSFAGRPWLAALDESTVERELEREERERIRRRQIRFNSSVFERKSVTVDKLSSKVPPRVTWNSRAKAFELAFRALRRLAAMIGNVDDEMNFHSLELDARRARTDVPLFERSIILLYRWFSDYGRSMWRPIWVFVALAAIIVSLVTPFTWHALDQAKLLRRNIDIPGQAEVAMYIARNFIPPPAVWSENLGRSWAIGLNDTARSLLSLLGTFQTLMFVGFVSLFLISMRRRFRIRD